MPEREEIKQAVASGMTLLAQGLSALSKATRRMSHSLEAAAEAWAEPDPEPTAPTGPTGPTGPTDPRGPYPYDDVS